MDKETLKLKIVQADSSQSENILQVILEATQWLRSQGIDQWQVPWDLPWIEWRISLGDFYCAFLEDEDSMAAVVRLLWSDEDMWVSDDVQAGYVHSLAVRPKFAGRGIGRQVLRWAEEMCRLNGRDVLRLDCIAHNSRLHEYYRRQGFSECGEKVFGDYHGRLFQKPLSKSVIPAAFQEGRIPDAW